MTMDYGSSKPAGLSMRQAGERALRASALQLGALYRRAGHPLTPSEIAAHLGVTPMIGRNDTPGEVFTLADARALVGLANRLQLGRVSMWSANRDSQCGIQEPSQVSNTCSGIRQKALDFTWNLGRLDGGLPGRAPVKVVEPSRTASRDNPDASPYPIWRPRKSYASGDEVVWHAGVYEAKWWTQGSVPDASVPHLWDTPWRYIGPVLPSDRQKAARPLRAWGADSVYLEGDRAVYDGAIYQAKWWTQADLPGAGLGQPGASPWELVTPVAVTRAPGGRVAPAAGGRQSAR